MKKLPTPWVKVTVHFRLDLVEYKQVLQRLVQEFEKKFKVKYLYFARYTNLNFSKAEISAQTAAEWSLIKRHFSRDKGVEKVEIETRDSGSIAHAYAYKAVMAIKPFDQDTANDEDFLDVVHWASNMRGLDYVREARLYSYGSLRFLHQIALEGEENLRIMRRFNAKVNALAVTDEAIDHLIALAEKGRASGKRFARAMKQKPKQPARAASGKVFASQGPQSSGPDHLKLTGRPSGRTPFGK